MRVAICYTKTGSSGESICAAFAAGVQANGEDTVCVRSRSDLALLDDCDVAVHVGDVNPHNAYTVQEAGLMLRCEVADRCGLVGIRRIVIDTGFLSNQRLKPIVGRPEGNRYFSVGLDGSKGHGNYYNAGSPLNRWQQLGLELKPWRAHGSHVMILGQMRFSASTYHLDIYEWYVEVAKRIREVTDRPILLRAHPNQAKVPDLEVANYRVRGGKELGEITEDLKGAWCVVTKTSNGAVDALVQGVPVICDDPLCMAYSVAEHELANLEQPRMAEREPWLVDLAYAQWNIDEMAAGLPWRHLRPHVKEPIPV